MRGSTVKSEILLVRGHTQSVDSKPTTDNLAEPEKHI